MKPTDGTRFGRLMVISYSGRNPKSQHMMCCQCDCGNVKTVRAEALISGATQSCGCLSRERAASRLTKHGKSGTREYRIWMAMKNRCYRPSFQDFHNYGGRGITVCQQWLDSFSSFIADMGTCPRDFTLERKDRDKNYTPDNCIWADWITQNNNTRSNRLLECFGKQQTISQWSREYGIEWATLAGRLQRGWEPERALTSPVLKSMENP